MSASKSLSALVLLLGLWSFAAELSAQTYTRRNSPYSRYGLGDVFSTQSVPSLSTAGAFTATYNSIWDLNLSNPASLAHIETTVFDVGVFYKHSALSESSTGLKGSANDGNLSYLALSFPITRSWELESDTLRRAVPIQWGMGISLLPHSTVGYDVRVSRELPDIGEVEYKYTGDGTRFRANWSNGLRYKGISVGANIGLLFGSVNDRSTIAFGDSAYIYSYNERISREENTLGLIWDLGAQYDLYLKKESKKTDPTKDMRLTFGAYLNGSGNLRVLTQEEQIRYGTYYGIDTLVETDDTESSMKIPLGLGAGISITKGMSWRFGINYDMQMWDGFSYSERPITMANSYTFSAGAEFTPNFAEPRNFLDRIRYRLGAYYGKDPRIVGSGANTYQLSKYGITFGLGLRMKAPKSQKPNNIPGQVQLGFEFGYLGHPELIKEQFFQVNLAFSLNDGSWFRRSKFR